jgi:two-component system sensor histidine kinase KdpD
MLETFANQVALALERTQLAADTERARISAESERMRNALLSSVSHDLRTPLATITGATTTLLRDRSALSEPTQRELLQSVASEARRLNRVVGNLLVMTLVEAAGVSVRKELHSLEEVVGAALSQLEEQLEGRQVELQVPADLPLVPCDAISIEQVLLNLIENAIKYSPAGTPITIRAEAGSSEAAIEVMDRGRGIEHGEEDLVFEKFYRGQTGREAGGVGLGLAICRAIISAHGGTIRALPREGGGAVFRFTLPLASPPLGASTPKPSVPATA